MFVYNLIITTTAEQHVIEACLYYEEQQSGLSDDFLKDLYSTYDRLSIHPGYYSFISKKDGLRDIRLHTFPYVVVYEVVDKNVIVLAVHNTYRKPTY